jgi:hypothetical protein
MPNRLRPSHDSLKASRKAFKTLQADRERFERNGIGPGEAYVGLWRACHDYIELLVAGGEGPYRRRRHIFGIGRALFGALYFSG